MPSKDIKSSSSKRKSTKRSSTKRSSAKDASYSKTSEVKAAIERQKIEDDAAAAERKRTVKERIAKMAGAGGAAPGFATAGIGAQIAQVTAKRTGDGKRMSVKAVIRETERVAAKSSIDMPSKDSKSSSSKRSSTKRSSTKRSSAKDASYSKTPEVKATIERQKIEDDAAAAERKRTVKERIAKMAGAGGAAPGFATAAIGAQIAQVTAKRTGDGKRLSVKAVIRDTERVAAKSSGK